MAGIFVGVEMLLEASDIGLIPRGLREIAYHYFAFYDLYFKAAASGQDVPPRFYWSFLTHAFLHGGLLHVAMNTAVFLALGTHLVRAVGQGAMLLLFAGTAVAGALTFGAIADMGLNFVPMVGASGALFGFLGVMKRWEWRFLGENGLPMRRFWGTVIALGLINVVLSAGASVGGPGVAWEAHLGGFVAGWLAGGIVRPRRGMEIGPI
jgi:membrane associated rhomboid family serine protease